MELNPRCGGVGGGWLWQSERNCEDPLAGPDQFRQAGWFGRRGDSDSQ